MLWKSWLPAVGLAAFTRKWWMPILYDQLQAASAVIGLAGLANNAYLDERRMQISNYLGVPFYNPL